MKQLTVRGVDDKLHATLKREARERGISMNRYVVRVLKQAVGHNQGPQEPRISHDLDHLAATWTREQAREFGQFLDEQRDIDEDLWR
jgi:plasmid stability protein